MHTLHPLRTPFYGRTARYSSNQSSTTSRAATASRSPGISLDSSDRIPDCEAVIPGISVRSPAALHADAVALPEGVPLLHQQKVVHRYAAARPSSYQEGPHLDFLLLSVVTHEQKNCSTAVWGNAVEPCRWPGFLPLFTEFSPFGKGTPPGCITGSTPLTCRWASGAPAGPAASAAPGASRRCRFRR